MMTVDDLRVVMGDLATSTKRYIAEEISSLLEGVGEKLAALEAKLAAIQLTPGPAGPQGVPGSDGAPGRDIDEKALLGIVEKAAYDAAIRMVPLVLPDHIREAVKTLPTPKDGMPGRDGKDADVGFVRALIETSVLASRQPLPDVEALINTAVAKALAAMPAPRDGAPGKDGASGRDAEIDLPALIARLKPEVTEELLRLSDMRGQVEAAVSDAVKALPPAKDGVNGKDGTTFSFGIGPPAFDSRMGDVYLDTKTGDIYQCR